MKIENTSGKCIVVRGNEIDTDRIIPARFMKVVSFKGLREAAFYDERYDADGGLKTHPFNDEQYNGASILLVNKNFGCGSSREHAPQALMRWGIKAIIGESFAEIFVGNCTSMGIPTAAVSADDIEALMRKAEEQPDVVMSLDISSEEIRFGDIILHAGMNPAIRKAMLSGSWDSTEVLLEADSLIRWLDNELPY